MAKRRGSDTSVSDSETKVKSSVKGQKPSKSQRIVCAYGRACTRAECPFEHPNGFNSRTEKLESPGKRRRREPSRSVSNKPSRPKRGREPSVEESKDMRMSDDKKGDTRIKEMKKTVPKKVTFREFMMNHCEDGASPEDAVLAFKVFCEDLVKKELDILKNTGLFFDLYHPMAQLRSYDWQRQMAQMRSRSFARDLNANKYHGLSLRARRPGMPGANVPMAPTCPVARLECQQVPWSLLACQTSWYAWCQRSYGSHMSSGRTAGTARVSVLESSELSAAVLPPEMSCPERLRKDMELSEQVIRKMDALFGISTDATAVLSHQLDTERQLDILLLREVDEWTLRDCCGAAVLRETSSTSGSGASAWAAGHEKRLHDFLQQPMDKEVVGRPVVLHHQEPKVLERFQIAANEKILKVHDQKFQCQACNKFFKGPEYVFKHLHRIHTNILDDIREELHQEIARSAFLADPAHPPAHAMTC
eukprot:s3539_g4.t1